MASRDSVSMMTITSYGPVTRSACTVSGIARTASSTLLPAPADAWIKRYARIMFPPTSQPVAGHYLVSRQPVAGHYWYRVSGRIAGCPHQPQSGHYLLGVSGRTVGCPHYAVFVQSRTADQGSRRDLIWWSASREIPETSSGQALHLWTQDDKWERLAEGEA